MSGLNEILLKRILDSKYQNDGNVDNPNEIDYFADGVVLVNPAIEASQILQTYESAMELHLDEENRRSLITIITSEDDCATRFLFPIGQTLDTIFTRQEQIERDYTPHKISEYDLDTTTIGHYKPFHTGNLIDSKTIESNKYLANLFSGQKKLEKAVHHTAEGIKQRCEEGQTQETNNNTSEWRDTTENYSDILKFREPDRLKFISPNHKETFGIGNSELIKEFGAGYIDCCQNPKACILSENEEDIICNKNLPLSFIYTNKVLIEDHNDVFNDNFVAFLLSGVTGTVLDEETYCNNKRLSSYSLSIQELVANCTDSDKNGQFSFSDCYSYFLKKLKSAPLNN
ncbi:MAG: hypothetical protein D3904_07450 [Candidatus Electrothrix sp. EH2]|nr:hypothetical protein [Candidatus Electrothrix sp. EH2]